MTKRPPTPRALDGVAEKIDQLPKPIGEPLADLDLETTLGRFDALCKLAEWADAYAYELPTQVATDLAALYPEVAKIKEEPASTPRPTEGPLAEELRKVDAYLERHGESPLGAEPREPSYLDPALRETMVRIAMRVTVSWVTYDGRPTDAESQTRHQWFKDRANFQRFAERLGYSIA